MTFRNNNVRPVGISYLCSRRNCAKGTSRGNKTAAVNEKGLTSMIRNTLIFMVGSTGIEPVTSTD